MANIFKQQREVNEYPNRNNFDLSRKSNVSLKMGTIYPVFCQPVVPGDSFDINAAYNLKLMPVVFPVQTKMRAHMHFFYVRNKNLWKNWQNWISNLSSNSATPHPYLAPSSDKVKTGSIFDFLGVPTTFVNSQTLENSIPFIGYSNSRHYIPVFSSIESGVQLTFQSTDITSSYIYPLFNFGSLQRSITSNAMSFPISTLKGANDEEDVEPEFNFSTCKLVVSVQSKDVREDFFSSYVAASINTSGDVVDGRVNIADIPQSFIDFINSLLSTKHVFISVSPSYPEYYTNGHWFWYESILGVNLSLGNYNDVEFEQYSDSNFSLYEDSLHINALPFRACESIYNAFYRNNVIDPLKDENDQPIYNKYLVNDGDGLDSFDYKLHQRNYELDFLTSALPSPQQGVAPLVGMTALGDITIEDENGLTTAHAEVDNDGTISKVVLTSPAASNDHARTAMNIAASGMSINDFRNTNALQRLLETNIRKGYRYLDFIAGHFGKEPEYRELDMPEFIGGFSRDVNVSTIVSQSDTLGLDGESGAALGQYGGFAALSGGSEHSIRHYCDDYGYIIGMLSVVPTPCYSQLLSKHMIAPDNFLDYYFPEFSQTGLQPITYREVAPIQAYLQSQIDQSTSITDTFGYQRPNYDMVSAVDEVHGEFRSTLRNFVINRIFASRPELGHDFIKINPLEVNDIFVDTNPEDDVIIGEIGFAVFAKRPVPRVVIPNLGR